MEADLQTPPLPSNGLEKTVVLAEPPMPTPKGYIRVRSSRASLDLDSKSVFLIDLSKVSKAEVRVEASASLTRSPTRRKLRSKETSPLRTQFSRGSYMTSSSAVNKLDEPIKYDLNKNIYERQKEWKRLR